MKRHRWLLISAAVFGVSCAIYIIQPREPEFEGRKLSAWLEAFDYESEELVNEAVPALRQMGTNVVGPLVRLLKGKDSRLKQRLIQLTQRQSFITFRFTPARVLRARAILACEKLGPTASGTAPALIELLADGDPAVRQEVQKALMSVSGKLASTTDPK